MIINDYVCVLCKEEPIEIQDLNSGPGLGTYTKDLYLDLGAELRTLTQDLPKVLQLPDQDW